MSAPPPQGAPSSYSPPSGGAIAWEPSSPSSGGGSSSRSRAAPGPGSGSSAASSSPQSPLVCAACRHRRQRCLPGCVLLPYFPADDPDRFCAVLRMFGVKNLLRTLREVPRPRWDACVRTIVCESEMRLRDPVRGCVGAIEDLEAQLVDVAVELEVLHRRLEAYRLAKRCGLLVQPPNPHGARAASSPGATNLDATPRRRSGRRTFDAMMQPQGPSGTAWPPAGTGLSPTRPRLSLTEPQFSAMQPQFSAMQPQLSAWPPAATVLTAAQPQLSAWPPAVTGLTAAQPQLSAWPPVATGLTATQPQLSAWTLEAAALTATQPQLSAWAQAAAALTAAQPQLPAMQQQLSAVQPQLSTTQPPLPMMQPPLSTVQQQAAMRRRQPTRGSTAIVRDGFGNMWAQDERRDPEDL